ncbi:hypothetical protein H5410_056300 [Solanum commersonii]|uniref:Protein TIC 214 n=1 Tax=Solanum commersonii TaxID=4109 RepID=A0A9J5WMQ5_SOLCO|nr:hypothetical protein H5410_056300 [Solanum commersonii]
MHEDNQFGRCGRTLLWISDHILHRALLSLPSPSSGFGKRNREEETEKTSEIKERVESEEERDVEIETASEMKGTKQEQEGSTEEDTYPSPSLFSEEGWDPDKIDETEEI